MMPPMPQFAYFHLGHGMARLPAAWGPRLALVLAVLGLWVCPRQISAVELSPGDIENRRCLMCHGQVNIATLDPGERRTMIAATGPLDPTAPPKRPNLYIAPGALVDSVHANTPCADCHRGAAQLPHAQHLGPAECDGTCHAKQAPVYRQSTHAAAAAKGNPMAPTCATCHGGHNILPKTDPRSRTYPLNAVKVCGGCHEQQSGKTPAGHTARQFVETYLDSVHGKAVTEGGLIVAATCGSCHDSHAVLPASDPRSTVNRSNVPQTCGRCHYLVNEAYQKSIHGQKLAQGDPRAPVCSDCHTAHGIARTDTPAFMLDIVNECGHCHDKPAIKGGRSFYDTYRQSYHGQVTKLGYTRAARCSDCHGAHDILPIADPDSRLNPSHRLSVCQHCHADAEPKFAQFQAHADYHDGHRYPLLHAVFLYFVVMMSGAFGFFGLHSVLWFTRSRPHTTPEPAPSSVSRAPTASTTPC
jgi:hypothetical protein